MLKSKYNSSITRVRPVFELLIERDSSGHSWLYKLLELFQNKHLIRSKSYGTLDSNLTSIRPYEDRVLKSNYDLPSIPLANCFEKSLPPPKAFLKWLIENTNEMSWPKNRKFGHKTQENRETLFSEQKQLSATSPKTNEALDLLEKHGPSGSKRRWWAFEGYTEADCFLETDTYLLIIEGKRTEPLSTATEWYPKRNQIIRNLEVAASICKNKNFGVVVISENPINITSENLFELSLPHFSKEDRNKLQKHFLGETTWKNVCEYLEIDFHKLPDTVEDVIIKYKL